MSDERTGNWILPALLCAAMLLLPLVGWLLLRHPHGVAPPRAVAARPASPRLPPPPPHSHHAPFHPASTPEPTESVAPAAPDTPVSGVVLDPDNRPVKHAFVGCEDSDQPFTTSTDEQGEFHLAPAAVGCVAVAKFPGFVDADRVNLVAGSGNTLRLNRMGGIEGEVVDERGAPLTLFVVAVESYQGPHAGPTGLSKNIQDKNGAYAFDHLVPGRYVLTASAPGRPPASSDPIDVEMGSTTSHVRITVARGATITGHILDASHQEALSGAIVVLDARHRDERRRRAPGPIRRAGRVHARGRADDRPVLPPRRARGLSRAHLHRHDHAGRRHPGGGFELNPREDGGSGQDFSGIGAIVAPTPKGVVFQASPRGGPPSRPASRPATSSSASTGWTLPRSA